MVLQRAWLTSQLDEGRIRPELCGQRVSKVHSFTHWILTWGRHRVNTGQRARPWLSVGMVMSKDNSPRWKMAILEAEQWMLRAWLCKSIGRCDWLGDFDVLCFYYPAPRQLHHPSSINRMNIKQNQVKIYTRLVNISFVFLMSVKYSLYLLLGTRTTEKQLVTLFSEPSRSFW